LAGAGVVGVGCGGVRPVPVAEDGGERLEVLGFGDAGEDEFGAAFAEESVVVPPAVARLGEVLEHGDDLQSLAAGFGDHVG
jgi:hypothetical protein